MKKINKVSGRIIALILSVMLLISMIPISIFTTFASDTTSLSTDVGDKTYYVGQEKEFFYTTNVADEDIGKTVIGVFKLLNNEDVDVISEVIEKLWYWDTTSEKWAEFPENYYKFGPPTGFLFNDGYTSKFKVKFAKSGDYQVVAEMQDPTDSATVYASSEETVSVKDKASELKSDFGKDSFEINEAKEFTYTTVANDLSGTPVLGTFTLKDSSDNDAQAYVKLEYYEPTTENWYEFYGDFGPANTGFPLVNAESRFRATFNKTGTYTVNAAMKKFDGGEILSEKTDIIEVKDTKNP